MIQQSDAPARNIPGLFLGDPKSGFRLVVDLDFKVYKVFGLLVVPITLLLTYAVPPLLLALGAARVGGVVAAKHLGPLLPYRRRTVSATATALVGLLAVLLLLVTTSSGGLLPMPWYFALLVAPVLAGLATWRLVPLIGNNTPITYWLSLLPRIARGPRTSRPLAEARATEVPLDTPITLSEIDLIALTIDPREVTVGTATPRVTPVEFREWTPATVQSAAETLSWVQSLGFATEIVDEAQTLRIDTTEDTSERARNGDYIVHNPHATDRRSVIRTYGPREFAKRFEVGA